MAKEYINSVMESHRMNCGIQQIPEIGANRPCDGRAEEQGEWMKGGVDERQSDPPLERKRWSGTGSDFVAQAKLHSVTLSTGLPSGNKMITVQGKIAETVMWEAEQWRHSVTKEAEARMQPIVTDDEWTLIEFQ